MQTRALQHLEALRRTGKYLFLGERWPGPVSTIYPSVRLISLDPHVVRGIWIPNIGLLAPLPVISSVFASPVAAALLAITSRRDGAGAQHGDEFADGTVALTLGENVATEGLFAELRAVSGSLSDSEPLGDFHVSVLPREAFADDRNCFPFPGKYVTTEAVPVIERVALTAGDLRALAAFLGDRLVRFADPRVAQAAPFTGPYSDGGHLQFRPDSGELTVHRRPSDRDRKAALALVQERGYKWIERMNRAPTGPALDPVIRNRTKAFGRALRFIEEHFTERLTIQDIAEVARMSRSHLHEAFRHTTGYTPMGYVTERKLDEAERLLRETDLSIAEISGRCGFEEQGSLSRSLKNRRGVTPSALRRMNALGVDDPAKFTLAHSPPRP